MLFKRILHSILPHILIKYFKHLRLVYYKSTGCKLKLITDPKKSLEVVCKIKDATWEDSYYPECYGHCKEQHLSVFTKEEYIFKASDAIVCNDSDVVITNEGVYWDKFNNEEFITWADPADRNVISYSNNHIILKKNKKNKYISGNVLSLLGVWAYHWGHCMYQFLPKLFAAGEAGLLDNPITVLLPHNEDKTIIDIVIRYLESFPNTKIVYAYDDIDYTCEALYFMPSPGSNFNNPLYRLDYPYYISKHVLDKIKKYVVNPIIEKVKDNKPKYEKIYLSRKGKRTAINLKEIDEFILRQGFVEIEGASLTLEQKADIFYHAKEIVGMYGSGFLNLIFCNKVKALVFTNYRMSTDTSIYIQIREYVADLINITGQDESSDYHSSTYYPLEKVIAAYNERIKTV